MRRGRIRFARYELLGFPEGCTADESREEEAWARDIRASADAHGVRFTQMHGPVHGPCFAKLVLNLSLDDYTRLVERSLRTAAVLGAPWVVFHPTNVTGEESEAYRDVLEFNVGFYRKFIPLLEETGVTSARISRSRKNWPS